MDDLQFSQQQVMGPAPRGAREVTALSYAEMKFIGISIANEEGFPDSKVQLLACLEQKRLLKFLEDPSYSKVLPVDDPEKDAQLFAYNCIAKSLQMGLQFPVIRAAERGNTYTAWQLVLERFEPKSRLGALTPNDRLRARKLQSNEDLESISSH